MFDFFNTNKMEENDCMTYGKCSNDPMSIAIIETFIYQLRQLTYYILKIEELGYHNQSIIDLIITTLASINLNFSYSETIIEDILRQFKEKRLEVINFYKELCNEKNLEYQLLQSFQLSNMSVSYKNAVIAGEQQTVTKNTQITSNRKNLYEIIIILVKNTTTLISKLMDYNEACTSEKKAVLEVLNSINFINIKEEKLIKKITNFAPIYYRLKCLLSDKYEQNYGKATISTVNFKSHVGATILISGDNLMELDKLLQATVNEDINIYTHDRMILAHQYPYFKKFSHLKGHYQNTNFNFPLDFSSFPGPILLTKNYSNKVDTIFKANFYSTDTNPSKGINQIKGYDFTKLIKSAYEMTGFHKNKNSGTIKIGYDINSINKDLDAISAKINDNKFQSIYIVGLTNYGYKSDNFFEKLYKKIGTNNFIISLAYEKEGENIYHINSFFDFSLIYKIIEKLKSSINIESHKLKLVLTQCTSDTLTNLFVIKDFGIKEIFITCCNKNTLNPSIMHYLEKKFEVIDISEKNIDDTEL